MTKEKKRSAAPQRLVGSKDTDSSKYGMWLMYLNMCARDEGKEAVCSAVEHGWKQGHGSHVLSTCGPCS